MFSPAVTAKLLEDAGEESLDFFYALSIATERRANMCRLPGMVAYLVRALPHDNAMGALLNLSCIDSHKASLYAEAGAAVRALAPRNERAFLFLSNIANTLDIYDDVVQLAVDGAHAKGAMQVLQSLSVSHPARLFAHPGLMAVAVQFSDHAVALLANLAIENAAAMCTPNVVRAAVWAVKWSGEGPTVRCGLDVLERLAKHDCAFVFDSPRVVMVVAGCMTYNESEASRTRAHHVLARLAPPP